MLATVAVVLGLTRIRMVDPNLRVMAWGGVLFGTLCWVGTGVIALFLVAV